MRTIRDLFGRNVRLTDERLAHVLHSHPEMNGKLRTLQGTLREPDVIVASSSDDDVELFYRHKQRTPFGEKYFCAVVKKIDDDLFILTFYFTDVIKKGKLIWKAKEK